LYSVELNSTTVKSDKTASQLRETLPLFSRNWVNFQRKQWTNASRQKDHL